MDFLEFWILCFKIPRFQDSKIPRIEKTMVCQSLKSFEKKYTLLFFLVVIVSILNRSVPAFFGVFWRSMPYKIAKLWS